MLLAAVKFLSSGSGLALGSDPGKERVVAVVLSAHSACDTDVIWLCASSPGLGQALLTALFQTCCAAEGKRASK